MGRSPWRSSCFVPDWKEHHRRHDMTAERAIKEPCRVAATSNITLSGLPTIGGIALASGDRVLVTAQTSAVDNGIYVAAAGAWTRATDFDGSGEAIGGALVA